MANKKFSEFELKTTTSNVSHIVGYNGAENVRITPANFLDTTGGPYLPLAGGIMVGDTTHNDNVKSIYGTSPGNDLQIYHSGTDGFIANATGDLKLSATNFRILKPGLGEFIANFFSDGAVELFNNNSKKFETTSTGISVTGNGVFTENAEIRSGNKLILQRPNNAVATEISTDVNGTMILNSVNDEGFKLQNSGVDLLEIGNVSPTGAIFAGDVSVGSGKFLRFPTAGGTGGNASINYDVSAFTLTSNNVNAPIIFKTSSAEKMRLDASGNLGIGLSIPLQKLHVKSTTTYQGIFVSGNVAPTIGFAQGDATTPDWKAGVSGNNGDAFSISEGAASVDRLIINPNGNVGIGVTSAISGTLTLPNNGKISFHDAAGAARNSLEFASGELKHGAAGSGLTTQTFFTDGDERMRLTLAGNFGIGTVSPAEKLSVIGTDNTNQARIGHSAQSVFIKVNGTNVDYNASGNSGGSHTFSTGNTERMRIDSNGDIDITSNGVIKGMSYLELKNNGATVPNTTSPRMYSPASGTLGFAMNGGEKMRITSGGDLLINTASTPDGSSAYGSGFIKDNVGRAVLHMATSTTSAASLQVFFNPNGVVGSISTNGSATSFTTSSDYRLKEDLQDFKGLDLVSKIPVYDYKWKADESRSYGVLAHQLQEVLPQAVTGEKDAEEMQSVDYSKIVPLLVKSIQELKAEIELLKNK